MHRRLLVALVAVAALAIAPRVARAQAESAHDEPAARGERGEEEHEYRFHFGFAGSLWFGFAENGPIARYGPGTMLEIGIVPGVLEFEPFVRVLGSSEGLVLPVDLLFEVPFHVSPRIQPFIALGPTIAPTFAREGTTMPWGGASAVGVHVVVARNYALLIEANYNLLYNDGAIENEAGASVGALVGL
jgi:hypothetical protein